MSTFIGIERLSLGPWQALERAILRFFVHSGFKDCRLVGGTGDKGADILSYKDNKLWVVQAKYRKANIAFDESVLKEVITAINTYSGDEAVVATNQFFGSDMYLEAKKMATQLGVPFHLWSGDKLLSWSKLLPEMPVAKKELRSYQQDAVDAVENSRLQGRRNGLIIMATGLGKTRVAGEVISREFDLGRCSDVLVLAHTVDLVYQFESALWEVLSKNISTHIWAGGEHPMYPGGVTCATMQTVIEAAKVENMAGRYSLVVVDEAHHAPADGYNALLRLLGPNFILGLTATPWRSDERALSDLFGAPVFTISIVEGMQQGYLAQVDYRMLADNIDWTEVNSLSKKGLTVSELNRRLFLPQRDEAIINKIVKHMEEIANPRCIIFCRTIEHANAVHNFLRAAGKPARVIHSQLGRIEATYVLREFRNGSNPTLISVEMLNEGIDIPDVNLVVFLRVTHSRRIFIQQLGRGLRISEGKTNVRILDFVADIRRLAAGLQFNREAKAIADKTENKETIHFPDGRIVKFSNDRIQTFFEEYLADVASVEDLNETSRLQFPPSQFV